MKNQIHLQTDNKHHRLTIIALLLIALALLTYTIIRAIKVELTMDEIYSWENLGSSLYPAVYDHTIANHHWLNSWLMQLSELIFGTHQFTLRLPNVIAHACFLFFSARIALTVRNSVYAIGAFVLLNAHPYMLDFFSAARGYGIAFACIAACLFFLFRFVSGEQSTKHLCFAILAAILALLANFAVISFVMMVIALCCFFVIRKKDDKRIKQLVLIAVLITPLLILVIPHLLRMQASGALYYGEETFWNGTVKTMVNKLLFDKIYHDSNSFRFFQPVLVVLLLFLLGGTLLLIRTNNFKNWLHSNAGIAFILFSGVIVIIVLQHLVLGTLYPLQRASLFIFVLFLFAIVTTLDQLLQGRALIITGALAAVTVAFYMFYFGNTGYLSEWEYSAGTQAAVDIMTDKYKKIEDGKPVTVSAMGGVGFPMEFIKKRDSLDWLDVQVNWQSDQPQQHDFYLIEGWAIPSFDVSKWIPVDTMPYSENVLYMDSAFVTRMK